MATLAAAAYALPSLSTHESGRLVPRQCGIQGNNPPTFRQELVGDGSPHQNYQYKQLTDPLDCDPERGCEIAATEVEGTSFGWSAGASVDGWISGGFEVSEYTESGQVANCYGEAGDTICVWWRAGYTSYTVQTIRRCQASDQPSGEPFYMLSPNSGGVGGSFICAKNEKCGEKGFEFWNDNGRPQGGPQKFPREDNGLNPPA
ncbi:hypothetical protein Slin14017_G049940 [Septoria linicola]|nr:hypothetical protein Slin14017_G049940 [Septoria linicola]